MGKRDLHPAPALRDTQGHRPHGGTGVLSPLCKPSGGTSLKSMAGSAVGLSGGAGKGAEGWALPVLDWEVTGTGVRWLQGKQELE